MQPHYIEPSVLVSSLINQHGVMIKGMDLAHAYVSKLGEIEVLRTLERIRHIERLEDDVFAEKIAEARWLLSHFKILPLNFEVQEKSCGSFPLPIKTLDALHVSTALWFQEQQNEKMIFCTLDRQQALCAKAIGLEVKEDFSGA